MFRCFDTFQYCQLTLVIARIGNYSFRRLAQHSELPKVHIPYISSHAFTKTFTDALGISRGSLHMTLMVNTWLEPSGNSWCEDWKHLATPSWFPWRRLLYSLVFGIIEEGEGALWKRKPLVRRSHHEFVMYTFRLLLHHGEGHYGVVAVGSSRDALKRKLKKKKKCLAVFVINGESLACRNK